MRLSRPRRAAGLLVRLRRSLCDDGPRPYPDPSAHSGGAGGADPRSPGEELGEMNNSLTNESAATIGFGLILADSLMSGRATTMMRPR